VETGADVPIPGCPTGAGLAIMLAGFDNTQVPDAGIVDRIVGFERLLAWAAAGQARALAELTTRRTAHDVNELPYAVEEVALALSCSRIAAGSKLALATDLAGRLPATLLAWEQGRICAALARVISEGTQRLSAQDAAFVEDQLLIQAQSLSPARLKVKVAALADSLDPREIEDRHIDAAAGRRVIKEPREDGMACLWALLPADQAATVWAGITARAEADRDPADRRTADQRRADALTDLATGYLSGATTIDPVTGQTGTPPRVPAWAQIQVKLDAGLLLATSTEPAMLRGTDRSRPAWPSASSPTPNGNASSTTPRPGHCSMSGPPGMTPHRHYASSSWPATRPAPGPTAPNPASTSTTSSPTRPGPPPHTTSTPNADTTTAPNNAGTSAANAIPTEAAPSPSRPGTPTPAHPETTARHRETHCPTGRLTRRAKAMTRRRSE
jgi:hypothetical protein